MKKSILKSMLVGSCLIVIITFIISVFVFSRFIQTSSIERESEILRTNVDRINDVTNMAYHGKDTYAGAQYSYIDIQYRKMIDTISNNLNASIVIFDNDGKIVTVSGLNKNKYIGKQLNKELYERIIKGNEINEIGLLDDVFGGKSVLTIGAPLEGNGTIYAGVLISRPVPEILNSYRGVMVNLGVVIIIAILVSMLLFYLISRRITTPVHKINSVVNDFSKGNFEKRVEHISDDEFGELSRNINRMADSLENLEKMRSTFVSDVSHELRTPMTTISGFVEGILDGTIDEGEKDRYLEIVLSESKRLSRLVTDLLNLTRMQNSEVLLNYSDFDITDLTFRALLNFEKQISDGNFEIETDVPDEKLMVHADKDAITQVLTNLIGNAVKFTDLNGKISISIKRNNSNTLIEIKNSGKGIEKKKLQYIWERFYKTDESRNSEKSGFGLGLSIVRDLVEKHQGKITVQSAVGVGSVFTLYFPVFDSGEEI